MNLDSQGDLGVRFTRGSALPLSPSRTYGKSDSRPRRRTLHPEPTTWPLPTHELGLEPGSKRGVENSNLRTDYFLLRNNLSDASETLDIVSDSSSLNEETLAFLSQKMGQSL